jgi:hypothetical protein
VRRFLVAIVAATLTISGNSALAQPATAPAGQHVDIAFAPPLDTQLRFRITKTKVRSDRPATPAVSWSEELRFVRSGDGFILHWRMLAESLPPEMRAPAVAAMITPFIGDPIAFDLDADGNLLRVRDWDNLKPKLLAAVDSSLPAIQRRMPDKTEAAAIIGQVRALFDGVDAEQATTLMLKNIAPVLHWGGTSLELGKTVTETNDQTVMMLGDNVAQTVHVTLTALNPGKSARIDVRTETDQASIQQLMATLAQRFGPSEDPARKAQMERELAKMEQMTLTDTAVVIVDLATGLPTTLDNSRKASVKGVTQTETLRIEWLR